MGLSPLHAVGLTVAHEAACKARAQLVRGIDPLQARACALANSRDKTFNACAREYIASHQDAWRNHKHRRQWAATLETYVSPHLDQLCVRDIDTTQVLNVLQPLWNTKTETATRLRGRIERVLSWATIRGYRTGDNLACWHGHLQKLLPNPTRVKTVRHHPALPYLDIGAFFSALQSQPGFAACALEMTILTACRTSEVLKTQWTEIDLAQRLWSIPGKRTKMGARTAFPCPAPCSTSSMPCAGPIRSGCFPEPGEASSRGHM